MSNTTRPPLLSDDEMQGVALGYYTKEHVKKYHSAKEMYNASYVAVHKIRDIYEAARAKDAELIQMLVDCIRHSYHLDPFDTIKSAKYYALGGKTQHDALNAAAEAGFKPTEP